MLGSLRSAGWAALIFASAIVMPDRADAVLFDPNNGSFTNLGALPTGNLTVNTGTSGNAGSVPTLTHGGGSLFGNVVTQAGGPDIAVFVFDGGQTLAGGNSLTAMGGTRGLALLFRGNATINGTINVSGANGTTGAGANAGNQGMGGAGGPGGFRGGNGYDAIGGFSDAAGEAGFAIASSGGGGQTGKTSGSTSGDGPGGGGGFGTDGDDAPGKLDNSNNFGTAHGDIFSDPGHGGGGGGGGGGVCCGAQIDGHGGGGSGGFIEIGALVDLIIGGTVRSDGGDGGDTMGDTSGGGGAGGGILLHGFNVTLGPQGLLSADGGIGGGCGGGGRIGIATNTNGSFTNGTPTDPGEIQARRGRGSSTCSSAATAQTAFLSSDMIGEEMVGTGVPGDMTDLPEPATLTLFGLGLAGLWLATRRRRTA